MLRTYSKLSKDKESILWILVAQNHGSNLYFSLSGAWRIFPRAVFAFFFCCYDCHTVNLPTLCSDTHVSIKKNFQNFLQCKAFGVGGLMQPPRTEREVVVTKVNRYIFVIFISFFIFPFVITMTMFLKYLRHKVDLARCFTFNL